MATTYTQNKGLAQIATGDDVGTWGPVYNSNMALIDQALGGGALINLSNTNVTLTSSQAQNVALVLAGNLTANVAITFPATAGSFYFINNLVSGGYVVTLNCAGGGSSIKIAQNHKSIIFCTGTDILYFGGTYQPFFRLSSPSTTIPYNTITTVQNYATIDVSANDNSVSNTTGIVTIGSSDAGIYQLTASCNTMNAYESAQVFIYKNGTIIANDINPSTTEGAAIQVSTSGVIRLLPGDQIWMAYQQFNASSANDTTGVYPFNQFSGVRVCV